jgi:uncharacterized membrane protein YeaQ/YmgE (transglycosylase-associated protein family)
MTIFGWIVLGLISGFIGSKLINKKETSLMVDVVLGMVGALVAGFVFMKADVLGITLENVYSILVALTGAVVMLFAYHRILKH